MNTMLSLERYARVALQSPNFVAAIVVDQHRKAAAPHDVHVRRTTQVAGAERLEAIAVAVHRIRMLAERRGQCTGCRETRLVRLIQKPHPASLEAEHIGDRRQRCLERLGEIGGSAQRLSESRQRRQLGR